MTHRQIFLIAFLIIVIDQITKTLAMSNIIQGESIGFIPGLFDLSYVRNTGIAFSLFNGSPVFLTSLISLIMLVFFFWLVRTPNLHLSYAFFLGGGLSNLLDRYLYGAVTDLIKPTFIDFPVFNVADICLNCGVALLLFSLFFKSNKLGVLSD